MTAVILQPSYLPWRGYFHQIQRADVFVFYDCVQYDKRGWRNRNRIKTAQGTQWLTVPVQAKGSQREGTPIAEIPIVWDDAWNEKHWRAIELNYRRAPFFEKYAGVLRQIFARHDRWLADLACFSTELLAGELGIGGVQFVRSSTLPGAGNKTERLLSILKHLGATHYISGPSARDYLEETLFGEAGIGLEYMEYDYPDYPQLHGPFEPQVSVLDLLLNTGPCAADYIWGGSHFPGGGSN